jgi:hypothetical protein
LSWVEMLRRLYELSSSFRDPREIIERFSEMGPMQFFLDVMGPQAAPLRKGISHTDQQIREAMMEGIRLAQDLCYCRDWSKDKEVQLKADPFGRDVKKLMNKIIAMSEPQDDGMTEFLQQIQSTQPVAWANEGQMFLPATMPEPEGHWDGNAHDDFEQEFHDEI